MERGSILGDPSLFEPVNYIMLLICISFQSTLPEHAKMVCLELYADKSMLSSFGTAKGYPVMARILNLPTKIRNGEGFGGGRVVGWLPLVSLTFIELMAKLIVITE
jgi:hypothetical protein